MPRAKPRAAKNEQGKHDSERALKGRAERGTSFEDLSPKSTLCGRSGGMQTRQESHEAYRSLELTPDIEKALKKWKLRMDAQVFLNIGYIQSYGSTRGGKR